MSFIEKIRVQRFVSSTLALGSMLFFSTREVAHAQCNDVVERYATSVPDACGWDNEQDAESNPGNPSACDTFCPPASCNGGGTTPYAVQELQSIPCGENACSHNFACSCPGDAEGGGTPSDCQCLLKATNFLAYATPAGKAIQFVTVDVQARFNHESADATCSTNDTGRIKVRVQLPTLGRTEWLESDVFGGSDGTNGQCRYRLGGGDGDITELLGMTNDPNTGRTRWLAQHINDLQLGVARVPDNRNSALRVNAFRIQITHCDDFNADQICDFCGDGVLNPNCGETCDGGDCCDSTCHYRQPSHICRPSSGFCNPADFCSGSSATCPDAHLQNGTPCSGSNACIVGESCNNGVCQGGSPRTCDDSNGCTSNSCDPASGCTYLPITPPTTEPAFGRPQNKVELRWTQAPGSSSSELVRGFLRALPVGPGMKEEVCLGSVPGDTMTDPEIPGIGQGFWYLVRGANSCGKGPWGSQGFRGSLGTGRNTTTCDECGGTCSWESLPPVSFQFGVSAGGGLATDGNYLYAADFSGDAQDDSIDLNGNLLDDPGEALGDFGIADASVRMRRFDPAAMAWTALPTLLPGGADCFSNGNIVNPLFVAGGKLFYYQYCGGTHVARLFSYDLSQGVSGQWSLTWFKPSDFLSGAMIDVNAAIRGVDDRGSAKILHSVGSGQYQIARSDDLAGGGVHRWLTPQWDFATEHFPNNGSFEYDVETDTIYHMSGDQILKWSHNDAAYPNQTFLNTEPAGPPVAIETVLVPSLRLSLGWSSAGAEVAPGTSLWGNSLTVWRGYLYAVRGEASADGWPFNEGRGLISSGQVARIQIGAGAASLPSLPFLVGKGSTAIRFGGYLYVTQGDRQTKPDAPGNDDPLASEGIRLPGSGIARFNISFIPVP